MKKNSRQAEQKRTAIKKQRFLSAFRGKGDGNITKACEAARVGRTTFYEWLKADEAFSIEVDNVNESIIDWGEERLRAKMRVGDTTAIIFFLKTKGKKRGYVERQEVTGAEGRPLNDKLTVEVVHTKGAEIPGDNGGDGGNGRKVRK